MKRQELLFLLLIGVLAATTKASKAQNACPGNPAYTYYHPVLDTFNTPVDSTVYWLHFKNEPAGTTFASPYYQGGSGADNIWPLKKTVDKDNKKEDGWTLLYHDFGQGSPIYMGPVQNPMLFLYNKYNSTLRVFFLLKNSAAANYAALRLEFRDDTESALLSHAQPVIGSVEDFEKNLQMSVITHVTVENELWYFADFVLAYDPCTCTENTSIRFTFSLITEAEISLTGSGVQTERYASTDSTGNVENEEKQPIVGSFEDNINGGVKSYNDITKAKDQLDKILEGFKSASLEDSLDALDNIEKLLDGIAPSIPVFGKAAIGLFKFFIGGGNKSAVASRPKFSELSFNISGTLVFDIDYIRRVVVNPGSSWARSDSSDIDLLPMYNQTLGICNLLETPAIERALIINRGNFAADLTAPDYGNNIWQFKVKDPLKFVVNPAAELELVDLNAAVLMEYPPGTFLNPNFPSGKGWPSLNVSGGVLDLDSVSIFERLAFHGIEVEAWPKAYPTDTAFVVTEQDGPIILRTPYYKATCFNDINFMLHDTLQSYPNPTAFPNFYCKMQARLRRTDTLADDSTKDVIYIATYFMDSEISDKQSMECDTCTFYFKDWPFDEPITPQTKVRYKYFYTDSTVHDDGVFNKHHTPWPTTWTGVHPGFFRALTLAGDTFRRDTSFYARDTVYLRDDYAALADTGADITIYAGGGIVVEADTGRTVILEADSSGSVVLQVQQSGAPPYYNACMAEPLDSAMATEAYVQNFCNSSKYNPKASTNDTSNRVAVNDDPPARTREPEGLQVRAYPNPFSERVAFAFELPEGMPVTVELYDLQGRRVARLAENKYLAEGYHELHYGGGGLTPGLYLCKIRGGDRYLETLRLMKH